MNQDPISLRPEIEVQTGCGEYIVFGFNGGWGCGWLQPLSAANSTGRLRSTIFSKPASTCDGEKIEPLPFIGYLSVTPTFQVGHTNKMPATWAGLSSGVAN